MTSLSTQAQAGSGEIRLAQAQRLRGDARSSAMIVMGVIIYVTIILFASGSYQHALIWITATVPMVIVTLIYAKFSVRGPITADTYRRYLLGHVLVTLITGIIWSSFSIYHTDYGSYTSLFVAGSIVCSITAGGMFPGSDYRPAYITLSISTILPLAIYWVLTAPPTIRYFALGLFLFFLFGLYSSARAEINSRDGIIARMQQDLTDETLDRIRIAREGNEEKSRFLAATSHDLSQPLHAQGYFLDALGYLLDRPDQRELLDKIGASWRAQKDMLDDLVSVTRLDGGVLDPNPQRIELEGLMGDLCREHQVSVDDRGVDIDANFTPTTLNADPTFLRRIIGNILSNAVKFSPHNGRVIVTLSPTDSGARVTVRDHGVGIPDHAKATVFEAYTQSRTNPQSKISRPDGSGLGLSIVKRLCEKIDASVVLMTPDDGPGLLVEINIPSQILTTADQNNPANMVIIIDDEADIRDAMMAALSHWGVQAMCAEHVDEVAALLRLTGHVPDLMIVDYHLADGVKGHQVIAALRAEFGNDIAAVLITGDVSQVERGLNTQIVPKPVAPKTLKRIVGLA